MCVIWGDPHVVTFDMIRAFGERWSQNKVRTVRGPTDWALGGHPIPDFFRAGDYWLVRSDRVSIQAQYRRSGGWALHGIAVGGPFMQDHVLSIEQMWNGNGVVRWDGRVVANKANFKIDGLVDLRFRTLRSGAMRTATVDLPDGVNLRMQRSSWGRNAASVTATIGMHSQADGQEGHCGKADGDLSDDNHAYMYNQGAEIRMGESLFGSWPATRLRSPRALLQGAGALAVGGAEEGGAEGDDDDDADGGASSRAEQCADDLPAADEATCAAAFAAAKMSTEDAAPFLRGCTIDVCAAQDPGAALAAVSAAAEASAIEGQIRFATHSSWCLEVGGGRPLNGSRVQLWPCNSQAARTQFLLPAGGRGQIRWAAHPDMCLDVSRGSAHNGNRIQVWRCKNGHPNMDFILPVGGKGQIRWALGENMCLDVKYGRAAHGTPIQLWECQEEGHSNKEFLVGAGAQLA